MGGGWRELFGTGGGGACLCGLILEDGSVGEPLWHKLPALFGTGGSGARLHGFILREDRVDVDAGSEMSPFREWFGMVGGMQLLYR